MIERLIEHLIWADRRANDALATLTPPDPALLRIQSHILGAEATWLARIDAVHAPVPVWPDLDLDGCRLLADQVHAAAESLMIRRREPEFPRDVTYTNTQGATFTSSVDDILHHMAMHAMYHRGQVMLGVRAAGGEPLPTDFIVFARGR